ncbi:related to bifunctional polynucleotide phosphatase/kinase [Rhynchosporium agropyri]|uniref:Related to bifunctional polynucleotide phosphatase/kinase n=1 Tax=Rhynchosporium agropyri TaxID=914238 RepID=A0A1E1K1U4_9HELO|nr:related to bifunctional polynucleotide phosphatase/kinase [Rhynchosporium agropyri]
MASSPKPSKRKLDHKAPISPPPLRRKLQSNTTQTAVASFFTPSSQKPPEKITWHERAPHDDAPDSLIVGRYKPAKTSTQDKNLTSEEIKRYKVAAFDFDSTLIQTSSGKKFASDAKDWKWWHSSVPATLRKLYLKDGFRVVILSNQAGISLKPDTKAPKASMSKLVSFKTKVSAVLGQLDVPISIYAATEKDMYRKPRTGMWTELLEDFGIRPDGLDLGNSIFVGDAGGRDASKGQPKDFSCSDRNFADNVGIKFYTPEEYFLGEAPRPFTRTFDPNEYLKVSADEVIEPYEKKNPCDVVLFCGSPAAGKSTFYWRNLEPLGYTRINQDILKTREKCLKVAGECLAEGKAVAIDNTNADSDIRKKWVELAARYSVPIRCVLFTAGSQICEHNDVVRALNITMNPEKRSILPGMAFRSFATRYKRPEMDEGFQDITEVGFKFLGNKVEQQTWSRHWT